MLDFIHGCLETDTICSYNEEKFTFLSQNYPRIYGGSRNMVYLRGNENDKKYEESVLNFSDNSKRDIYYDELLYAFSEFSKIIKNEINR